MKRIILTAALAVASLAVAMPGVASARQRPLTWHQAHVYAGRVAHDLPIAGDYTGGKINWCNRWSNWRVDCGVEADGHTSTWDDCKTLDSDYNCVGGLDYSSTECDVTVDVLKSSRTGHIWTRQESDLSCLG